MSSFFWIEGAGDFDRFSVGREWRYDVWHNKWGRRGGVKSAAWKNTGYLTLRRREQICRKELERFIRGHPFFLVTLEPYHYHIEEAGEGEKIPEVVRRMINASTRFGIGPISAVAITLAELAVEAMHDASATHAMVDNRGDVALINDKELVSMRVTARSQIVSHSGLSHHPHLSVYAPHRGLLVIL